MPQSYKEFKLVRAGDSESESGPATGLVTRNSIFQKRAPNGMRLSGLAKSRGAAFHPQIPEYGVGGSKMNEKNTTVGQIFVQQMQLEPSRPPC